MRPQAQKSAERNTLWMKALSIIGLVVASGCALPVSEQDEASSATDTTTGRLILTDALGEPHSFSYRIVDGEIVHEGDVILGKAEELDQLEKGFYIKSGLWGRVINYSISHNNATMKTRIANALSRWASVTGLRFNESASGDYIDFIDSGTRCMSEGIGKKGGRQRIYLPGTSCTQGNVIHEIGHALGLLHEHTRCDRNDTIKYFESRVLVDWRDQFVRATDCTVTQGTVGNMDFGSIMIYASYGSFLVNSTLPAMVRATETGCDGASPPTRCTWTRSTTTSANDKKTACTMYNYFYRPKRNSYLVYASGTSPARFCQEQTCGFSGTQTVVPQLVTYPTKYAEWNGSSWVTKTASGTIGVIDSVKCRF